MVRLTDDQIHTLIEETQSCFGKTAQIWIFGSRTDDSKKGGDIDLYIETDLSEGLVAAKLKFRSLIWPQFGEQKIDILVRSRTKEMNPMHLIAKDSGQLLSP